MKIVIKHGITNAISSRAVYILGTKNKTPKNWKKQLTYSVWAEGSPPDSLGVHYDLIHPSRVTSSVGHVTVPHLYTPSFVPHITILSKKPEGRMGGSKNWNILKKLSYEFKNCFKFFIFIMRAFLRIFHDLWLFVKIVIKYCITNAISSRAVYILGTK